jgi:nitrogen fixation protein NifB
MEATAVLYQGPLSGRTSLQHAVQVQQMQRWLPDASRPGRARSVLEPWEAVELVETGMERNGEANVVCSAGPGESLVNEATFSALHALHRRFPKLTLCVSTNGLLLFDRIGELVTARVRSITITINAVSPATAQRIYSWVLYRGKTSAGLRAGELLIQNQWQGLINAIESGLLVKVTSVFIPGVNDDELPRIAELTETFGADILQVLPMIPQTEFKLCQRPSDRMLSERRDQLRQFIKHVSNSCQCCAHACVTLGEKRGREPEVLSSEIGKDRAETAVQMVPRPIGKVPTGYRS